MLVVASIQLSLFVAAQNTSSAFTLTCTWMAGSSNLTVTQAAVYGSPGIASASADPGGRYSACSAASVSGPDALYLFGGSSGPVDGMYM